MSSLTGVKTWKKLLVGIHKLLGNLNFIFYDSLRSMGWKKKCKSRSGQDTISDQRSGEKWLRPGGHHVQLEASRCDYKPVAL